MAIPGKRLLREDAEAWYVEAAAGENWHDFVQWTLAQGWPGLENLSLIPGLVGAAPIQNIGAYGLEVGELLHSLSAWDFEKQCFLTVDRKDCRFAYRDSLFKQEGWHLSGRLAIVSVIFRLPKAWQANIRYADVAQELASQAIGTPTPQDIAAAISAVRQRKLPDPALIPNSGSFFHNPVVSPAQAATLAAEHPTPAALSAGRRPGQAGRRLADRASRLERQGARPGRHVRKTGPGPGQPRRCSRRGCQTDDGGGAGRGQGEVCGGSDAGTDISLTDRQAAMPVATASAIRAWRSGSRSSSSSSRCLMTPASNSTAGSVVR